MNTYRAPSLYEPKADLPMYGYGSVESRYNLINRPLSPALKSVIQNLTQEPSIHDVLNLGCGDGILESNSQNRTFNYTSIDLEPAAIHNLQNIFQYQKEDRKDEAIVGDITNLDLIPELDMEFDAAVSWRVLHGVQPICYDTFFQGIYNRLTPGSSFFISVASDQDWKAKALEYSYNAEGMNDCADVMFRNYDIERKSPFNIHFFTPHELEELGETNGFDVKEMELFQELSGYEHLKDKKNTYLFAHFTKQESSIIS